MVARAGDRPLTNGPPPVWKWHEQRAAGVEAHFDRVRTCGEGWSVTERCETDACRRARAKGDTDAGIQHHPVGCCSRFFCAECRSMLAVRFRRDFNAARQGVLWQSSLAGLTGKWRKGGRFGERLITLPSPHVGTLEERIAWHFAAWPKFLKKWNEWHRAELGAETVVFDRTFTDASGKVVRSRSELPAYELCQHARFWECTEGDDGEGHPHFHVWAFGPFLPVDLVERWWREAWCEASGVELDRIVVDVRKAYGSDVDRELVKYLTKDWTLNVEQMARLYAALGERRARQASRGFFSTWAVPILRVCQTCGVAHERGEEGAPVTYIMGAVEGSALAGLLLEPARGPPVLPDLPTTGETFETIRQALSDEVYRNARVTRGLTEGLRGLYGRADSCVRRGVIQPVSRRDVRRAEKERLQCKLPSPPRT